MPSCFDWPHRGKKRPCPFRFAVSGQSRVTCSGRERVHGLHRRTSRIISLPVENAARTRPCAFFQGEYVMDPHEDPRSENGSPSHNPTSQNARGQKNSYDPVQESGDHDQQIADMISEGCPNFQGY
jgi:hypothetical protein